MKSVSNALPQPCILCILAPHTITADNMKHRHVLFLCYCNQIRCFRADSPKSKKAKAIPLQAWTGLKGSRRLRLPDFKTTGT